MGNGVVTTQGKTTVSISNGKLVYNTGTDGNEVLYNTMTTPKGREYQLVLPDGTTVWLNAASSITYPTAFTGKNRNVAITGEAYFEVVKDQTKPFHVKMNDTEVEVLGTHFNINAYPDEASINTTLLEGSVRVIRKNNMAMLKPGQQAQVNTSSPADAAGITVTSNADLDQVMAWKNGSFQFDGVPLSAAMRQLSRWYDVEVVYEKGVPDIKLGGEMKRDLNLSQVLKGLGKLGVNCKVEGKKLVVAP
jgi:ferric-dicitrate binding protein FerR (iron transport regulator)